MCVGVFRLSHVGVSGANVNPPIRAATLVQKHFIFLAAVISKLNEKMKKELNNVLEFIYWKNCAKCC